MKIRKIVITLILAVLLTASASAAVSTGTVNIGGSNALVVFVSADSNTLVAPLLPNSKVGVDAPPATTIKSAADTVVAAMNGNFFNAYYTGELDANTDNYPRTYGALVLEGKMINSGGDAALGITYDGKFQIGRVEIKGKVTLGGVNFVAWGVNTHYEDPNVVYILTEEFDYPLDIPSEYTIVQVKDDHVTSMTKGRSGYVTPDDCITVVIGNGYGTRGVEVGDPAEYTYTITSGDSKKWSGLRNIIGASGMLVEDGVNVVDKNPHVTDEKQDPDLVSQRSFVALLHDGRLMMGVVTSSFRRIADSLINLGVNDAIFLDGGGSTMLYADGSYLAGPGRNLSSILAIKKSDKAVTQAPKDEPSAWAASYISEARSKGVLSSELDCNYKSNITRGEFCQLISACMKVCGRYIPEGEKVTFKDTTKTHILKVASVGVVTGYSDGTFKPGDSIKRQDAAVMLQRLAKVFGMEEAEGAKTFSDAGSISSYAKEGVDIVTALGIMNGNADGTFNPGSSITREQAVITIMNMLSALESADSEAETAKQATNP